MSENLSDKKEELIMKYGNWIDTNLWIKEKVFFDMKLN